MSTLFLTRIYYISIKNVYDLLRYQHISYAMLLNSRSHDTKGRRPITLSVDSFHDPFVVKNRVYFSRCLPRCTLTAMSTHFSRKNKENEECRQQLYFKIVLKEF